MRTETTIEFPSETWTTEAQRLGTATLHEAAGQVGALPSAIRRITADLRMAGRALPVRTGAVDNLWIHRAVAVLQPGDVLVATVADAYEAGYWGEILSTAAKSRGAAGVVIDGCVRDSEQLLEVGVPVFARGLCIRGTTKTADDAGALDSVQIGDVVVNHGDVVVGDADGVVVLPSAHILDIIAKARAREAHEAELLQEIVAGRTTLELFNLHDGSTKR